MTVEDLIDISGGLIESAYSQAAEISRIDISDPNRAARSIILTDLSLSSSSPLQPSDYVEFRTIPEYRESETITLEGEFVFPGTYVFAKGETLSSVIKRAGGFTNEAFIDGSIFLRESLRQREQEEIDRLKELLNDEISTASLTARRTDEITEEIVAARQVAVTALSDAVASGRLVVPISDIMANRALDVSLMNGDRLMIPKLSQEVTTRGSASAHFIFV